MCACVRACVNALVRALARTRSCVLLPAHVRSCRCFCSRTSRLSPMERMSCFFPRNGRYRRSANLAPSAQTTTPRPIPHLPPPRLPLPLTQTTNRHSYRPPTHTDIANWTWRSTDGELATQRKDKEQETSELERANCRLSNWSIANYGHHS